MKYFDAHTHAHFSAFKDDYKEVIKRALAADVSMILVGTQTDTSRRAVEVAHEFDQGVYAAVGIHPVHTDASFHDEDELGGGEAATSFTSRGEEFDFEYYKKLGLDPLVVAIGECGLDYYRATNDMEQATGEEKKGKQKRTFIQQIELAHAVQKPLMIHCRDAYSDLIEILKANSDKLRPGAPGVIHFFAGTIGEAQQFLDLGFSFTFGGAITFPPRKGKPEGDYDEVIKFLSLDRILSETDAPYVAPVPHRGTRNEPAYVIEVVKRLAELKNVATEEMAAHTLENAKRVFKT